MTAQNGVTSEIAAGETPTFGIFVAGTSDVPFDPANNRAFVRFTDDGGVVRSATSVAVWTQEYASDAIQVSALYGRRTAHAIDIAMRQIVASAA